MQSGKALKAGSVEYKSNISGVPLQSWIANVQEFIYLFISQKISLKEP